MNADWLVIIFYSILLILLLSGFIFAIQAFRGRVSWGQARVMGVTATLFVWIEAIFFLVVFESAFGIVSFVVNRPFWVDLLMALIVFLLIGGILFKLSRRNTFKLALFLPLVLVPLGIPGVHMVAKLVKVGCVEITEKSGMYFIKSTTCTTDIIKRPWPQIKKTVIGEIKFKNSHEKGRLGDRLSALRLTGIGYKKINSKINSLHGIDGVYIKKANNGKIREILIVENKVDGSQLSFGPPKQMSDEWVIGNAKKMLKSNDKTLRQTAELIIGTMNNNPALIQKQLWKHDLETGHTSVKLLGKDAELINTIAKWDDVMIANELRKWCNKGKLECLIE